VVGTTRLCRSLGRVRGRLSVCAALTAVFLSLCAPTRALAGMDTIYAGVLDYNGAFGPRHSLSSVWETWFELNVACANALTDGDGWAGDTFCAGPGDENVGHPYCACQLRYGFGRAWNPGTYSDGYWRQFW
jgi:hypothetical protein